MRWLQENNKLISAWYFTVNTDIVKKCRF